MYRTWTSWSDVIMISPIMIFLCAILLTSRRYDALELNGRPRFAAAQGENDKKISLSTTERTFEMIDIAQTNLHKASRSLTLVQCPGTSIIHRAYAKAKGTLDIHVVPHRAIFHEGLQCGSAAAPDGYLLLIPWRHVSSAGRALINNVLGLYDVISQNNRAMKAAASINRLTPVTLGVELTGPRICNRYYYPNNTMFFFIRPDTTQKLVNFKGISMVYRHEVGMVSMQSTGRFCLYKQTRRLAINQSEHLTVTPTPSPVTSPFVQTADMFQFSNSLTGIFPLFPVVSLIIVSPSPTPTVSPTVSETSSITPTISFTSSITPTISETPSITPTISMTPSISPTVSFTSSTTPTASVTSSISASPSMTSSISPSASMSLTPSSSPSPSQTPSPGSSRSSTLLPSSPSPSALLSSSASSVSSGNPSPSSVSGSSNASPTSASTDTANSQVCFPNDAIVVVIDDRNDWNHVPILQLQIGQRVLVQNGQFSFVFASTHNDSNNVIPRHFVQLKTRQGFRLTLSASHYVPIVTNGMKLAADVLIGDSVMLWNGSTDEVISSQRVWKTGLHNPQTLEGTIVVDGVVASTFTSAVEPITATALLTPIRSLFLLGYSGLSQM